MTRRTTIFPLMPVRKCATSSPPTTKNTASENIVLWSRPTKFPVAKYEDAIPVRKPRLILVSRIRYESDLVKVATQFDIPVVGLVHPEKFKSNLIC